MILALPLLLILGCAEDSGDPCRTGTERANDGHCYPTDLGPRITLRDALGDCNRISNNGAIDIASGCASGACAGATYVAIVEALGEPGVCTTTPFSLDQVYCTWADLGIDTLFPDENRDRVPDTNRTTPRVRVFPPNATGTVDGLGLGASAACFFDVLGPPSDLRFVDVGGDLRVSALAYDEYGLEAYDFGDDDRSGRPDGRIDNLYLYGAR